MHEDTKAALMSGIEHRVQSLFYTVREYESDTFSASAEKLTEEEAIDITVSLIEHAIEKLIDLETLDGVRLAEELENIRD